TPPFRSGWHGASSAMPVDSPADFHLTCDRSSPRAVAAFSFTRCRAIGSRCSFFTVRPVPAMETNNAFARQIAVHHLDRRHRRRPRLLSEDLGPCAYGHV